MEADLPSLSSAQRSQRYNGLLATVTGISSKELTRNLAEFTAAGLVARDPAANEVPYWLTDSGIGLMPTFQTLLAWANGLSRQSNEHSGALTGSSCATENGRAMKAERNKIPGT